MSGRIADTLETLVTAMLEEGGQNQVYHLTRTDVVDHDKSADCVCGPTVVSLVVGETAAVVYMHHPLIHP